VSAQQVIFIVFAALMLVFSFGVVVARNQVYAAMSLVMSMFFLAAIYALLSADAIAILQVLVYAGAIVVLFLFVIMLLSIQEKPRPPFLQNVSPIRALSVLAAAVMAVALVAVSMNPSTRAVVKSVQSRDGAWVVTFDQTPFRGSLYATSPLGTGEGETSHFEVLSVGMQVPPQHVINPLGMLPKVGDVVRLTPAVGALQPSFGTLSDLGMLMYSRYLLPFEVTSLLLLVAIVGAVVVAKERV
jgi:NADH-quinone oxidoreductase subunit J